MFSPMPDVPLAKLPEGALLYRAVVLPGTEAQEGAVAASEVFAPGGAPTLFARSPEEALLLPDAPALPAGFFTGNSLAKAWFQSLREAELRRRAGAQAEAQAAAEAAAKAAADSPSSKAGSPRRGSPKRQGSGVGFGRKGSKASVASSAGTGPGEAGTAAAPALERSHPVFTDADVAQAFAEELASSPAAGVFKSAGARPVVVGVQVTAAQAVAAFPDDDAAGYAKLWAAVMGRDIPEQATVALSPAVPAEEGVPALQMSGPSSSQEEGKGDEGGDEGGSPQEEGKEGVDSDGDGAASGDVLSLATGGAFQLLQGEHPLTRAFYRNLQLHGVGGFACRLPHRHELARLVGAYAAAHSAGRLPSQPPGGEPGAGDAAEASEQKSEGKDGGAREAEEEAGRGGAVPTPRMVSPRSRATVQVQAAPSVGVFEARGGGGGADMADAVAAHNAVALSGGQEGGLPPHATVPVVAVTHAAECTSLHSLASIPLPPTAVTLHLTGVEEGGGLLSLQFDAHTPWAHVAAGLRAVHPALGAAERMAFALPSGPVYVDELPVESGDGAGTVVSSRSGTGSSKRDKKGAAGGLSEEALRDGTRTLRSSGLVKAAVVQVTVTLPPPPTVEVEATKKKRKGGK